MKKTRPLVLAFAVLLGIGGSLANGFSRITTDCASSTQYKLVNGIYYPAGLLGMNYRCDAGNGTCTYYLTGTGAYMPCQLGVFHSL